MLLKVRTSKLANCVGTCVEIKVRNAGTYWLISTQVIAQPDTTLGVARACRDASPEAAAVMIVALAAGEDINRFWPVLSQWEAWVKSQEMGSHWKPKVEMRHVGDAAWRQFNRYSDAAEAFGIHRSEVQILSLIHI